MDGGDVMEVEVYKKRGEHWKRDQKKREKREKETKKNIERKGVNNIICT